MNLATDEAFKNGFFPTVYDLVYYYVLMDRTTHTHTQSHSLSPTPRERAQRPSAVPQLLRVGFVPCSTSLGLLSLAFMLPPGCRSNWWHWLREERGLQQRTTLASSTHTHTHRTQIYANAQTNKHTQWWEHTLVPPLRHTPTTKHCLNTFICWQMYIVKFNL